jgi:hypothetical protein
MNHHEPANPHVGVLYLDPMVLTQDAKKMYVD